MTTKKNPKPIVVLHPVCLAAKATLEKAGYVVVIADDPQWVTIKEVDYSTPLLTPDATLVAAVRAISDAGGSGEGPKTRFGRHLAEVILEADAERKKQRGGCCAWLADRGDEERAEAEAGAIDIHSKRPVIAGCYPVGVPLYLVASDLHAKHDDVLLAATELVKLGLLDGNPDVPLVIAHHVRINAAGREWIRTHDAKAGARS